MAVIINLIVMLSFSSVSEYDNNSIDELRYRPRFRFEPLKIELNNACNYYSIIFINFN